jgi:fatty-acyl-CoA synthase
MNLSTVIDGHAAATPDKVALRFGEQSLTYAALSQRIARVASGLQSRLDIGCGDRVAILALNHPDYLVLLYACARLGAMLVPVNWRLALPEQIFILNNADVKALAIDEHFPDAAAGLRAALPGIPFVGLGEAKHDGQTLDEIAQADAPPDMGIGADAPLLIVYTSGTTGRPKGAVLKQEALFCNASMSHDMHAMTASDHVLTVLPMFHVGGLNIQTTPALHIGARVTIHPRFSPEETLAAIERDRPSLVVLVPSTIQAMIQLPHWRKADLSSLRAVTTGSTQVPLALIEAVRARGVPVLQVYGSTETSPVAVYNRLGDGNTKPASTGLPGLHCKARVVDDDEREVAAGQAGEIVVRGKNVFTEYWRDPQATAETLRGGWYHSGDIGTRDADGDFFVHDRKKNMIISGGENIYAAEVERVLQEHPAVAECAIVGKPDAKWQEVPVAFVVLRAGHSLDAATMQSFVGAQLARFKVPRELILAETLPRNAIGKVQHFLLRETLTKS